MRKGPPLSVTHPHLEELLTFLDSLNKESERGAVLIAATMIDDLLAKSILAFLVEIDENKKLVDGFNAPLGAFSARILAAYALGILEETEYQECERIRKIRNEFAHNVKASFKSQKIIDITSTLHFSAKDDPTKGQRLPTKGKFTTAAVALILNLTNRPRYASDRRLKAQIWAY